MYRLITIALYALTTVGVLALHTLVPDPSTVIRLTLIGASIVLFALTAGCHTVIKDYATRKGLR